jgi:hypothetical protein
VCSGFGACSGCVSGFGLPSGFGVPTGASPSWPGCVLSVPGSPISGFVGSPPREGCSLPTSGARPRSPSVEGASGANSRSPSSVGVSPSFDGSSPSSSSVDGTGCGAKARRLWRCSGA